MPRGYLKHNKDAKRREQLGNNTKKTGRVDQHNHSFSADGNQYCGRRGESNWKRHYYAKPSVDYDTKLDTPHFLRTPSPPPPPEPRFILGECQACWDTNVPVLDLGKCGHTLCKPCADKYYTQRDLEIYPLHCAICDKRVSIGVLKRDQILNTTEDVQRVVRLGKLAMMRENTHKYVAVTCPWCREDNIVQKYKGKHQFRCRRCKNMFISKVTHAVDVSPKEMESVLEAFSEPVVRCPLCGTGIVKNGGCPHMTCRCGAHFEWNSHAFQTPDTAEIIRRQTEEALATL